MSHFDPLDVADFGWCALIKHIYAQNGTDSSVLYVPVRITVSQHPHMDRSRTY